MKLRGFLSALENRNVFVISWPLDPPE